MLFITGLTFIALLAVASASKCNVLNRMDDFIKNFNEKNFADLHRLYSRDALRYVNGGLDKATNGLPYSIEMHQCLAKQTLIQITKHSSARLEDDSAAAALRFDFGSKVTETRILSMGMGLSLSFSEKDCSITEEHWYVGQNSEGFAKLMELLCVCNEWYDRANMCSDPEPVDPVTEISRLDRVQECWSYLGAGNAADFTGCFAPGGTYEWNSRPSAVTSVEAMTQVLNAVAYSNIQLTNPIVSGNWIHVLVSFTITVKATGDQSTGYAFQRLHFVDDRTMDRMYSVLDTQTAMIEDALAFAVPSVSLWNRAAAQKALPAAVAAFGYPSLATNVPDAPESRLAGQPARNFVYWNRASLIAAGSCFSEAWLRDQVFKQKLSGQDTRLDSVLYVSAPLTVPDDKLYDVRSLTASLTYDELAGQVYSRASSPVHAMVDFWFAARLAGGEISLTAARAEYVSTLVSAQSPTSEMYKTVTSEVCGKLGQ